MTVNMLWDEVNNANTREDIMEAESLIQQADISVDDYNDLMMALSQISRELYRR